MYVTECCIIITNLSESIKQHLHITTSIIADLLKYVSSNDAIVRFEVAMTLCYLGHYSDAIIGICSSFANFNSHRQFSLISWCWWICGINFCCTSNGILNSPCWNHHGNLPSPIDSSRIRIGILKSNSNRVENRMRDFDVREVNLIK